MPRRLPTAILPQARQREIGYRYGKSHLIKERRLPAPVVPTFAQKVALSDGSTFTHWTTSPRSTIRLTRDLSNSPLWTLSATASGGRATTEDDSSGRMGRFRSKFGSGGDFDALSEAPASSYPTRLSLDGNQQPFQPQPQQDEEEPLKEFHQSVDEFTEEDLNAIYRDLLRLDVQETPRPFADSIEDPSIVLPRLAQRILPQATLTQAQRANNRLNNDGEKIDRVLSSLSSKLQSRLSMAVMEPLTIHISTGKSYSDLLNALQSGISDAALPLLGSSENNRNSVVMTVSEWTSLVEGCLQQLDFDGAFTTLRLMKDSNVQPSEELCDHIMRSMAEQGLFREIQAFNAEFLTDRLNHPHLEHLLHALTKCRLYSTAVTLLHTLESSLTAAKPTPPPMQVYEILIGALLRSPGPGHHARVAQAWDIFYNMRYLAHPVPSASLYAKMIAACGDSPSPSAFSPTFSNMPSSDSSNNNTSFGVSASSGIDTHRGLDLWHEFTVTNRQTPTVEAYNAIISLLARSKSTAHQAYTYAQEMLDLGRDADGRPQMPLDQDTLLALTEAAKRLGDLRMARWALLKMARLGEVGKGDGINQMALRNVFYAYATYKAPFRRDVPMTNKVRRSSSGEEASPAGIEGSDLTENLPVKRDKHSLEDVILPQTSQAVLAEADALFEAILQEKTQIPTSGATLFPAIEVAHLRGIAQIYLNVYFNHSPDILHAITKVRQVYRRLLDLEQTLGGMNGRLDLMQAPDMIRNCLFHCGKGRGPPETEVRAFVNELWNAWQKMEGPDGLWGLEIQNRPNRDSESLEIMTVEPQIAFDRKWIEGGPSTPTERAGVTRTTIRSTSVAKAWASYIHFKVRCGEVDDALALVRTFEHKYPPSASKDSLHPAMPTESSVALAGPRTLIKMSQRSLVDDDSVPPILVFTDVATLHNSLVRKERVDDVGYLTWLLHTYAGGVRDRRGMNLWVGDVQDPARGRTAGSGAEILDIREKEEQKVRRSFERRRRTGRLRMSLSRRH